MFTIALERLTIESHIGWGEDERQHPQPLILTLRLSLATPLSDVAQGPDLNLTVDYQELVTLCASWVQQRPWKLLEELAQHLGQQLTAYLRPKGGSRIELRLEKPQALKGAAFPALECVWEHF